MSAVRRLAMHAGQIPVGRTVAVTQAVMKVPPVVIWLFTASATEAARFSIIWAWLASDAVEYVVNDTPEMVLHKTKKIVEI